MKNCITQFGMKPACQSLIVPARAKCKFVTADCFRQVISHRASQKDKIPQTAVWGSFKSYLQTRRRRSCESPKRQFRDRLSLSTNTTSQEAVKPPNGSLGIVQV